MHPEEQIEEYIATHITPEPEWLRATWLDTWLERLYPRMCSGHLQGSILTMLTAMAAPRHALEIGTYSGYSAMAIAAGLPCGGHLDTIEIDDEHEEWIRRHIAMSPYADRISLHIGDALEVVPALETKEWDMVYVDADKRRYTDYYRMLLPRIRPGGYMLVDNTLWSGKVAEGGDSHDRQCRGIMEFNDLVAADKEVTVTILPLRDGLTIIRKTPPQTI